LPSLDLDICNHDEYKETISYLQETSIYDRERNDLFEEMRDYGLLMLILLNQRRADLGMYFHADFFSSENVTQMMAGDKNLKS